MLRRNSGCKRWKTLIRVAPRTRDDPPQEAAASAPG
ncbi:hypothetical protein BPC006_I1908 [Burkholderia pseudomallei BPC006]|nr:hypothetical protein BPC006_I1908 [Burkholderia pseudomallei BPC006]